MYPPCIAAMKAVCCDISCCKGKQAKRTQSYSMLSRFFGFVTYIKNMPKQCNVNGLIKIKWYNKQSKRFYLYYIPDPSCRASVDIREKLITQAEKSHYNDSECESAHTWFVLCKYNPAADTCKLLLCSKRSDDNVIEKKETKMCVRNL